MDFTYKTYVLGFRYSFFSLYEWDPTPSFQFGFWITSHFLLKKGLHRQYKCLIVIYKILLKTLVFKDL